MSLFARPTLCPEYSDDVSGSTVNLRSAKSVVSLELEA